MRRYLETLTLIIIYLHKITEYSLLFNYIFTLIRTRAIFNVNTIKQLPGDRETNTKN